MKFLIHIFILITFVCNASKKPPYDRFKMDDFGMHVNGSILLTCTASQLHYNLTNHESRFKSILFGSATSLFISIGLKEFLHDRFLQRGVFSLTDIAANGWGTACGVIIMICKFDFDEKGFIRKNKPRKRNFNDKKYILD